MNNKISRGPLSIALVLSLFLSQNMLAQGFDTTYTGTGALSLAKEGNYLRIETCEDSSRVDLIVDQQGNVVRREVFFRGSCRSLYISAPNLIPKRLSNGNFMRFVQNAMFENPFYQILSPNGRILYAKQLVTPFRIWTWTIQNDTTFWANTIQPNSSNTGYITNLYKFDSLGNIIRTIQLDTAMKYDQFIELSFSKNYVFVARRTYEGSGYGLRLIQKFDNNGNLLANIPFPALTEPQRFFAISNDESKILYGKLSCASNCVYNGMSYMDSQTGLDVSNLISEGCQTYLLRRSFQVKLDADDNVWLISSGREAYFGTYCPSTIGRIDLRKFSKDGKLILSKSYNNIANDSTISNDFAYTYGLEIADDGSIFVAGSRFNKTWLLKLNCVGEPILSMPSKLCIPTGLYFQQPNAWIKNLTLNGQNSTADSSDLAARKNYSEYKTPLTTLQRGQNYPLSIKVKTDSTHSLDSLKATVWLDFNRNGQIEIGESFPLTRQDSFFRTTILVPNNARKGMISMRARLRFTEEPTACDYNSKGEVEDYYVNIDGTEVSCDTDNEPPTIRCPAGFTVLDTNLVVTLPMATATDNCTETASIVLLSSHPSQTIFKSSTVVRFTATDRNCNQSSCNVNVVVDINAPDLTLTNLAISTPSVQQGQILSWKVDIKNIGRGDATDNFTVKSYFSKDTILSANDVQDGIIPTGNYAAGLTIPQVVGASSVPTNLVEGSYYLILKVDADNQIAESNENNNVIVSTGLITVTAPTTGGEDIALSIVGDPSVYRRYSTHNFKITAVNSGTTAFSNVKIKFTRPANTVSGGTKVASIGTFNDYCPGSIECSEWNIPTLAGGTTATLDAPIYILTPTGDITATAALLSSTPTDVNTANNTASVTINPAIPLIAQPLEVYKPTQLIPVVIQKIHPTITQNYIIVELESIIDKMIDFSIFNSLGINILNEKQTIEKGNNKRHFDVSQLPKGLYFIQTSVDKGQNVPTKFIKM